MNSVESLLHRATQNPGLVGWVVFSLLFVLSMLGALLIYNIERDNEMLRVRHEAESFKAKLESALNHSTTATRMLAFLVENDLITDNFDSVSADLLRQNKFIDAVQLVKGTVITNTYPIEGNEVTIGFDISTVPDHVIESTKAIERNELYFEGPFNLRQGGRGTVGRFPIIKGGELWGFSAVVIRADTFVSAFGIDTTGMNDTFMYELSKDRVDGSGTEFFFNHADTITEGIYFKTSTTLGDWDLYVKTINPGHWRRTLPVVILGLLLSILMGILAWFIASQPLKLQRLINERTASLAQSNQELEKRSKQLQLSNDELEQFAYIASHDLQEPLRMVTGFLTKLQKSYDHKLDDKGRQYIFFAVDGATRMRSIIIDLLEYSRIGGSKEPLASIDLEKLINEVRDLQHDLIESSAAQLFTYSLPTIIGYRTSLLLVFANLINNAIKYSREQVPPVITISAIDRDTHWEIAVQDNGIGIEEEYYDRIFALFQRLHAVDEYSGTGMGLAIVKKIIEQQGGSIRLTSVVNEGSTFYIRLPKLTFTNNEETPENHESRS